MKAELRLKKIERREDNGDFFYHYPFVYYYEFADKSWWMRTCHILSDADVAWLVASMRRSMEKLGMSNWGELSKGQMYSIAGDAFNALLEARARREIQAMVKLKPLSTQAVGVKSRMSS